MIQRVIVASLTHPDYEINYTRKKANEWYESFQKNGSKFTEKQVSDKTDTQNQFQNQQDVSEKEDTSPDIPYVTYLPD